ncbi:hypothetical protein JTB14_019219 [Gonioctena quinquepunctata]|nr:hypothetical protein JTB14_019219 [Gonioctena quinquepunctata]
MEEGWDISLSYRFLFRSELETSQNSLIIYTDESKTRDGVNAAMVVEGKEYSCALNSDCSIFTKESKLYGKLFYFSPFIIHEAVLSVQTPGMPSDH